MCFNMISIPLIVAFYFLIMLILSLVHILIQIGQVVSIIIDQLLNFMSRLVAIPFLEKAKNCLLYLYLWLRLTIGPNTKLWWAILAQTAFWWSWASYSLLCLCDSQAMIYIAKNLIFRKCTNHIDVDSHFVRDCLTNDLIYLNFLRSTDQLTDLITK